MGFILAFLGAFLGIIAAIAGVVLIIYFNVRKHVSSSDMRKIANAAKYAAKMQGDMPEEKKNVTGMTSIYEPLILKDFPDFNKEMLYNKVETSLKAIFNSLESKKISETSDLEIIHDTLEEQIEDLKSRKLDVRYDDVKFHRHAIKGYKKANGIATIITSSTLEYYYKGEKNKSYINNKKQTRYTCEFVYAYDSNLLKENKDLNLDANVFVVNCPNCGAPLNNISEKMCIYCGSKINDVNMKIWKICSYSEDYK